MSEEVEPSAMNGNGHAISRDEALMALKQDREARAQVCIEEVREVLDRHRCAIQAVPQLVPIGSNGAFGVSVTIQITAQD